MRIRIPGHFYKIYGIFLQKNNFQIFFSHIFILKLDEPFRNEEMFIISLFFKSSDFGLRSKKGFFAVDIYPLDPDPGSQNLPDPTDPDPKH